MKVAIGDVIPPFQMERVSPERMKTVAAILPAPPAASAAATSFGPSFC